VSRVGAGAGLRFPPVGAGQRVVAARTNPGILAGVLAVAAVSAGVVLRVASASDLWLDEALSVHIADLPLGDMVDALRRDGHPPLYYVLLHSWTAVFGTGDEAVRLFSGVISMATLPLVWVAGHRYGGRPAALAALLLIATNPFAIRYATEARMYSLVVLLVVLGWLALRRALDDGAPVALGGVALTGGLLLLTHYWSFYLLAATGLVLLWLWRRGHALAGRCAIALAASAVVFLPWLPSFLDQVGSTGTPWGEPERPTQLVTIMLADWGGGPGGEALLLGAAIAVLVALALFARATDDHHLELDLRTRPHVRAELVVVAGTLAIATLAGYATASAFASRYTATVFPLAILVAGYGVTRLPTSMARGIALVATAALGLVGGIDNAVTQRTQGGDVARYIEANGAPGDVVAFCPDQLGPSVVRVLPDGYELVPFPAGGDARFVDWVDYEERMASVEPGAFADELQDRAGSQTIWLVWSGGYRTLDSRCEAIATRLQELRPGGRGVVPSGEEFEHMWLYQYGPA
jgi:mannosyltransferase